MAKKFCPNHPTNKLWSDGVCIICYRRKYAKPLKRTPLAPISEKQKKMLIVYRMLRRKYLANMKMCELNLDGCTKESTEIHHTAKKYSKALWLNVFKFKAVCRNCHMKVEESPALAKELGIYNYKILNEEDTSTMCIPDREFIDALKQTNNEQAGSI